MKKAVCFFRRGFQPHTGYVIEDRIYEYDGSPHIGHVVYQVGTFFWITIKEKVACCLDREDLERVIESIEK